MSKVEKLNLPSSQGFVLIGLVSAEPIYRLSYFINNVLQISLKENEAVKLYHQKRKLYQKFIAFDYFNKHDETIFTLMQNKGEQGLLIEEQKQIDFWFRIDNYTQDTSEILSALKTIEEISLVFELNPDKLKSKKRICLMLKEH